MARQYIGPKIQTRVPPDQHQLLTELWEDLKANDPETPESEAARILFDMGCTAYRRKRRKASE